MSALLVNTFLLRSQRGFLGGNASPPNTACTAYSPDLCVVRRQRWAQRPSSIARRCFALLEFRILTQIGRVGGEEILAGRFADIFPTALNRLAAMRLGEVGVWQRRSRAVRDVEGQFALDLGGARHLTGALRPTSARFAALLVLVSLPLVVLRGRGLLLAASGSVGVLLAVLVSRFLAVSLAAFFFAAAFLGRGRGRFNRLPLFVLGAQHVCERTEEGLGQGGELRCRRDGGLVARAAAGQQSKRPAVPQRS
jgi:hypothetical protein